MAQITRREAILHVCRTGEKEQFYTLYLEVKTLYSNGNRGGMCKFIQNLAHKLEDAQESAIAWAQRKISHYDDCEMRVWPEPRPIYTSYISFGDIEMKMSKKRTTWWGKANEQFWEEWRTRKAEIKAAGYWVKRMDGVWLVFKRCEPEEVEWEAI